MAHAYSDVHAPLFVNTTYEYDLDMTLFPGISDPVALMQPALLIHEGEMCRCKTQTHNDLQSLIESCPDLECSETDSFIDDMLDDSDRKSPNLSITPLNTGSDFSNCSISTSFASEDFSCDIPRGISPIDDFFTPDITRSLKTIEQTSDRTALPHPINEIKRKLFDTEDNDSIVLPTKRSRVSNCNDEDLFSVLDDLFNHV